MVASSGACLLWMQVVPRFMLLSGIFFYVKTIPSSAYSRRAKGQLLVKEWALNTGKLSPIGFPRNSVVK